MSIKYIGNGALSPVADFNHPCRKIRTTCTPGGSVHNRSMAFASSSMSSRVTRGDKCITFLANTYDVKMSDFQQYKNLLSSCYLQLERLVFAEVSLGSTS